MRLTKSAMDWIRWGHHLQTLRRQHGWSQAELAKLVGVAKNTITRLEIGNRRPSVDLIERLAHVLRISLAELLDPRRRLQ